MLKSYRHVTSVCCATALVALGFSLAAAAPTSITACGTFGAGSYIVANNITSAGIPCLVFNAGPVTLDLNGFTISSTTGLQNGVFAAAGIDSVTVRNGIIKGFARGVALGGKGAVVDKVQVLQSVAGSLSGILAGGNNATVENCVVSGHNGGGIQAGLGATVVHNTLTGNTGDGIVVSDGSSVRNNNVTLSSGLSTGIKATQNCKVVDNVIANNTFGVSTGDNSVISGNAVSACFDGISGGNNTTITGNNSNNNSDRGIGAGSGCLISNNNASNNGSNGIAASGSGTQLLNNVANNNGHSGMGLNGSGGSAIGNIADDNSNRGLDIDCPGKADNNTFLDNSSSINTFGPGCLLTNNLAP
jgi:parallel beta-helix repeat protein